MKKTYQNPTIKVVRIHPQIVAASVQMHGKNAGGSAMAPQRNSDWSDYENN